VGTRALFMVVKLQGPPSNAQVKNT